jgi:hypothetical protein
MKTWIFSDSGLIRTIYFFTGCIFAEDCLNTTIEANLSAITTDAPSISASRFLKVERART